MRGDRENIEKTLNLGDARLSNMNKVLVVIKLLLNKVLILCILLQDLPPSVS